MQVLRIHFRLEKSCEVTDPQADNDSCFALSGFPTLLIQGEDDTI